ncbi:MAG: Holliday junction resolvase RuvX [Oscillospiraceae bacterium]
MRILAVDYGEVRTGLAVCDRTEFLASPVGVIEERKFEELLMKVMYIATEHGVGEIIVGHPKNMDGSEGEKTNKCRKFAESLEELSGIPVKLWDERRTTITAHNILNETDTRGKKRKEVIDAVAATVLLESYLRYRELQRKEE